MFYLKPEYRKQGIGKKMFTLVEEDAKQRGAFQLISSFNLKQPLEGFYQKMGFETTHVAVAKEI
jgi:GNAT superfamily N-acetyltransferase